jgi:hypothetical protein
MLNRIVLEKLWFTLSLKRLMYVVTLSIFLTANAYAESTSANQAKQTEHIEIGLDQADPNAVLKIDVEISTVSNSQNAAEQIANIVHAKSSSANNNIIFSTDNAQILETTLNKNANAENIVAVPIPKESQIASIKNSKFASLVKKFATNVIQSAKNDKTGLMVTTYTTGAECYFWIHSAHMSQFERTSNVVYSIGLALIFGVNKDMWAKTARPFQTFFRTVLKQQNLTPTNPKEIGIRFLGNLSLAAIVTGLRIPLLSMDQIISTGIHFQYFSMPILMTIASTMAGFTWSEHIAMINEKTQFTTKFTFRRANELRSFIIGTLATTAALLDPSHYGYAPWITLAGVGAVGSLVYANADSITKWVEQNSTLVKFAAYFKESPVTEPGLMMCNQLF